MDSLASSLPHRHLEVFRFLDLPPELRNTVYFHALVHDRPAGRKATPALLRTCKQIYAEGNDILYSQSTFSLKILHSKSFNNKDVEIVGDLRSFDSMWCDSSYSDSLLVPALPPRLPEIRHIHLHFLYSRWEARRRNRKGSKATIHTVVRDIAMTLGYTLQPRTITCVLEIDTPVDTDRLSLHVTFAPLYYLPATTAVRVMSQCSELFVFGEPGMEGKSKIRIAAINESKRRQHVRIQKVLERDVMENFAGRENEVGEVKIGDVS